MKNRFTLTSNSFCFFFLLAALLVPLFGHAQVYKVTLSGIQACSGATLIPYVQYTGTNPAPVTVYYERLVGADVWHMESSQVYNPATSYVMYNGDDLMAATTFRVRAIDQISGSEYISNSVSINPATWGSDRGTAFINASAYWGSACTGGGTIVVQNSYNNTGRPPFNIEYKKTTDNNFTSIGLFSGAASITGIEAGIYYNVRITDYCGKVTNTAAILEVSAQYRINQDATTCNNGKVTLEASSDQRYSGVAPFTYALGKYNPASGAIDTVFTSNNIFENLGPGLYYYYVKDACGNKSRNYSLALGSSFTQGYAEYSFAADACLRNIIVKPVRGKRPFTYLVRHSSDPHFTVQSDSLFQVDKAGSYLYQIVSACGDSSAVGQLYVDIPMPYVSSVDNLSGTSTCFQSINVNATGSSGPYEYAIRVRNSGTSFTYQTSPVFNGLALAVYEVSVRDRCGNVSSNFEVDASGVGCTIRTTQGVFESVNSQQGCTDFSGDDWNDVKDDDGNLIFSINPRNNVLPDVCWGVRVENGNSVNTRTATINGVPVYFLDRNFYIEPAANSMATDSVGIRIYMTNTEVLNLLNFMNNASGMQYTLDDIRILKKSGSPGSPVDLEVTNDAISSSSNFTVIRPIFGRYGYDWYMEFKVKSFSEFNPSIGNLEGALPLKLNFFRASEETGLVQLDWSTTEEINTDRFEIQWSINARDFEPIGTVPTVVGQSVNRYHYTHRSPVDGVNYYRLKMIDQDGSYTFSPKVSVLLENDSEVIVSPNPVADIVTIRIEKDSIYNTLKVYNTTGNQVLEKTIHTGELRLELDIRGLPDGLYLLELSGVKKASGKFVKF